MATEVLAVPEERLREVIEVIRAGLRAKRADKAISRETRTQLAKWCDDEEEYLDQ